MTRDVPLETLKDRAEKYAADLLYGPLKRRHFTALTRDALADALIDILQKEDRQRKSQLTETDRLGPQIGKIYVMLRDNPEGVTTTQIKQSMGRTGRHMHQYIARLREKGLRIDATPQGGTVLYRMAHEPDAVAA